MIQKTSKFVKPLFLSFFSTLLFLFAFNSSASVVLQYHHISDKTPVITSTSPALFEKHLDFLIDNKFLFLTYVEFEKAIRSKKALPDRSVLITFDDAYRSVYDTAYPLLKKRKIPFIVFANSQAHDTKHPHYLTWDELRELKKAGVVIANHTDSHAHLIRQREGESDRQFQQRRSQEIDFAQKRLEKELGDTPKAFAYPYGEYDRELKSMLSKRGYLAFGQQSGPVSASSDQQLIPRFPMGGIHGSIESFATKVTSVAFPYLKTRIADSSGRSIEGPVLPSSLERPILVLSSPSFRFIKSLQCFASGQGATDLTEKGQSVNARALRPLPLGRSRYNCTAPAGGGRYYWWSQMFIRKDATGKFVGD